MRSLGFASDPHVQYLTQILEEIRAGGLRIPKFQRPPLWDWDRQLDLLRSIRDGVPMGAIMIWRTNVSNIKTYDGFGILKFPGDRDKSVLKSYLLDGVQRLTTLVAALLDQNYDNEFEGLEDGRLGRRAYFDLEDDDFIAIEPNGAVAHRHLNLSLLLDSVELLKFQRRLQSDEYIRKCDELLKAFNQYKIPIIPIATDDVELASLTFKRVNSAGKQMSELHMVHALTWTNDFNLFDNFDLLREELVPFGWGDLSDDDILKVLKAGLGLDIYRTSEEKFGRTIRANIGIIGLVTRTLQDAAKILKKFGVPNQEFVPYSVQVVALSEFFRSMPYDYMPPGWVEALEAWFEITSHHEMFAGMSGDRINNHLNLMKECAASRDMKRFLDEVIPSTSYIQEKDRFDIRTARSRILAINMGRMLGDDNPLDRLGKSAIQYLLPRKVVSQSAFQLPANRIVIDPLKIENLRFEIYSGALDESSQIKYLITRKMLDLLKSKRYNEFLYERQSVIKEFEENVTMSAMKDWLGALNR